MNKLLICLILVIGLTVTGCPVIRPLPDTATDPSLSWDLVTTDCTGAPIVGPVTYNVYATQAVAFTTVSTGLTEVPCSDLIMVDTAIHTKLNSTPITAPPFMALVADGLWLFTLEAVNSAGNRGGMAVPIKKTVKGRAGTVLNFNVK